MDIFVETPKFKVHLHAYITHKQQLERETIFSLLSKTLRKRAHASSIIVAQYKLKPIQF